MAAAAEPPSRVEGRTAVFVATPLRNNVKTKSCEKATARRIWFRLPKRRPAALITKQTETKRSETDLHSAGLWAVTELGLGPHRRFRLSRV